MTHWVTVNFSKKPCTMELRDISQKYGHFPYNEDLNRYHIDMWTCSLYFWKRNISIHRHWRTISYDRITWKPEKDESLEKCNIYVFHTKNRRYYHRDPSMGTSLLATKNHILVSKSDYSICTKNSLYEPQKDEFERYFTTNTSRFQFPKEVARKNFFCLEYISCSSDPPPHPSFSTFCL